MMICKADFEELFPEVFLPDAQDQPEFHAAAPDPMEVGLAMAAPAVGAALQALAALAHAPEPLDEAPAHRDEMRRPAEAGRADDQDARAPGHPAGVGA